MRRKISTTMYLEPVQVEELHRLTSITKVPMAEFVRQALERLLEEKRAAGVLPPRES